MARAPIFERSPVTLTAGVPGVSADLTPIGRGLIGGAEQMQNYQKRVDRLELLDMQNSLFDRRLRELTDNRMNIKKKGAKGFTETEADRLESERDDFLRDVPFHLQNDATRIFNRANQGYLSQIGRHEIGEVASWESDQVKATVKNYGRSAVNTDVGDFDALIALTDEMKKSLPNHPHEAEIGSRDMVIGTLQTWASMDPVETEKMFHRNAAQLQRILGDDFNMAIQAVRNGTQFARAEKEYNYRIGQRRITETQDNTLKNGMMQYLDEDKELTPAWIMHNQKDLSPAGVSALMRLVDAQSSAKQMTVADTDPYVYASLSRAVHHRDHLGMSPDELVMKIAGAANKSITTGQARTLIDIVAKEASITPEQREALTLINDYKFDEDDPNYDMLVRRRFMDEFNENLGNNPNFDPQPLIDRITHEHKKGVQKYVERNYTRFSEKIKEPGDVFFKTKHTMPVLGVEDQADVDAVFEKIREKNPDFTYTPKNVNSIWTLVQQRRAQQEALKALPAPAAPSALPSPPIGVPPAPISQEEAPPVGLPPQRPARPQLPAALTEEAARGTEPTPLPTPEQERMAAEEWAALPEEFIEGQAAAENWEAMAEREYEAARTWQMGPEAEQEFVEGYVENVMWPDIVMGEEDILKAEDWEAQQK